MGWEATANSQQIAAGVKLSIVEIAQIVIKPLN